MATAQVPAYRIRRIRIIRVLNNFEADVTQLQTIIIKINKINRFVFIFHACWLLTVADDIILYVYIQMRFEY